MRKEVCYLQRNISVSGHFAGIVASRFDILSFLHYCFDELKGIRTRNYLHDSMFVPRGMRKFVHLKVISFFGGED
jgi:hypothetical protein